MLYTNTARYNNATAFINPDGKCMYHEQLYILMFFDQIEYYKSIYSSTNHSIPPRL